MRVIRGEQGLKLVGARRRRAMEVRLAVLEGVGAGQRQNMQVHVQVQFRANSLNKRHQSRARPLAMAYAGALEQCSRQRPCDHTQHSGQPLGPCREQQAQRPWERQHPLAIGRVRQHIVDQVRTGLSHAP